MRRHGDLNAQRAEQVYRADEVAALLGISRATFYTLAWFRARKVRVSARCVGYLASDVTLYQALRRGLPESRPDEQVAKGTRCP